MIQPISIITVNLNNAIGLKQTIDSVISQSFKCFEFIIIDGGSTDASLELILQNKSNLSYWISENDKGIYDAMNKGINVSKGKYLLFLNSGDYLADESVLADIFKQNQEEDILWGINLLAKENKIIDQSPCPEQLSLQFFYNQTIPHQSTFISKRLFEKYGYYNVDLQLHADYEFWIRTIILNGCSTKRLNSVVSVYNLEGVSSDRKNLTLSKTEILTILQKNIPTRILIDYETRFSDPQKNKVMEWINSNGILYGFNRLLYRISNALYSFRVRS
jgi:glycosyltransferase involved in cell wall biosynthesis